MNVILTTLAGLYLTWWALRTVRGMGIHTCHSYRLGVILVGASGLGFALLPLYDSLPAWLLPSLLIGISVVVGSDRRKKY